MPLDEYLPSIDNRRFDDIVAEIRTRIPRYTPEWTDLNDNEPGMAMLQVFAWLSDMMLYRMGRVPELNYLKFLQLLDIELSPATPAQAEITFPVLNTATTATVDVPKGVQVSAEADDGELAIFETERHLVAFKAALSAVQTTNGPAYIDLTSANADLAQTFAPFGRLADQNSALLLGFDASEPFPANQELNIAVWTPAARTPDATIGATGFVCAFPETPAFPDAKLVWEYWEGTIWQEMVVLKDETRALTRSGHIYLRTPAQHRMKDAVIGQVNGPRFWIRVRIEQSSYARYPELLAIRTNTVQAIQAETIEGEILGGSDGSPNQRLRLERAPVLPGSLELTIDEGDANREWTLQPDLLGSGPNDAHFELNRTTGEIRFGDGRNGSIPNSNPDNPGNAIVAERYRYGGGSRGNVDAGAINALVTPLEGIDQANVANLFKAHSGRDEESIERAKQRAPRALRSQCRAVSARDFEHLAREAADIQRAKALPLYHPRFPEIEVPGVMTVIVIPDSDAPNPTPGEGTLRTVCAYLNQRRLLTTELYVIGPTYRLVKVHASVIADNDADRGDVREAVEARLRAYFHPLTGGETEDGWPFGGNIYYSLVYRAVISIPGVNRIESLEIMVDGESFGECQDVPIERGLLVYSTEHDIQVNYAFDD